MKNHVQWLCTKPCCTLYLQNLTQVKGFTLPVHLGLNRVEQPMSDHLRQGLLAVFVGEPHCLWCPQSRWRPPLGASIALKIGKNELQAKKLQPLEIGRVVFYRNFLLE